MHPYGREDKCQACQYKEDEKVMAECIKPNPKHVVAQPVKGNAVFW